MKTISPLLNGRWQAPDADYAWRVALCRSSEAMSIDRDPMDVELSEKREEDRRNGMTADFMAW